MNTTISRLKAILDSIGSSSQDWQGPEFSLKKDPNKWSKKEILGHLVDSGIANLDRFNKIQFSPEPLSIVPYPQDDLVKSNNYQEKEVNDILNMFLSINTQIVFLFESKLMHISSKRVLINEEESDLDFLCRDYVDHMLHHLKQLK